MLETMTDVEKALVPWGNSKVLHSLTGGYRNAAYLVELGGSRFVAKTSRRSEEALVWLKDVYVAARAAGFVVPELIHGAGKFKQNGFTLEPFIEGRPISSQDFPELLEQIRIFHQLTQDLPQRPGFASAVELLNVERGGDVDLTQMSPKLVQTCREAWQRFENEPQSVVHGDLNPSNVLRTLDGSLALLDWDEARVDLSLFDTLSLQRPEIVKAEEQFLQAWEMAVCWLVEPEYAQKLAKTLI